MSPPFQIVDQTFGGLNEDDNPTALAESDLTIAKNVWHFGTSLWTRPGLERDTDTYTAQLPDEVQGIFEHRRDFDATRTLLVVNNGQVSVNSTPTNLTKAGGATVTDLDGNLWLMTQHQNTVYGAGGSPTDDLWYSVAPSAGGTINPLRLLDLTATSLRTKFIFEKWNYLFACRFYTAAGAIGSDLSANPTVVRFPTLGSDYTLAANWPTGNTIGGIGSGGLGGDFRGYLTGFGSYADSTGDFLLVLATDRIASYVQTGNLLAPFQVVDIVANGCVHQRAFVPLGLDAGDAVYLSRDGIHSLRQSQVHGTRANAFLSWKIRKTFNGLNKANLHKACGGYWPREGIVLFAVPSGTSTSNNLILCLDVKHSGPELSAESAIWSIWDLNTVDPSVIVPARDSNGQTFLYVGTYSGDVCRFNTAAPYSDLALAYPMQWRTKHRDFGLPGKEKQIGDCWIKLQPGGAYQPQLRAFFDFGARVGSARGLTMPSTGTSLWGSTFVWGSSTWGAGLTTLREHVQLSDAGETIALDLTHEGINQPVGIAQLVYQVGEKGKTKGD